MNKKMMRNNGHGSRRRGTTNEYEHVDGWEGIINDMSKKMTMKKRKR